LNGNFKAEFRRNTMIGKKQVKRWLSAIGVAFLAVAINGCGGNGGTATTTKVTALGSVSTSNGSTTTALPVSAPSGVTLSIPALTTMTDAAGAPVSGSIATSVSYSTAAADLPQAASQLPAGATLVAFADISMGNVKQFSAPIALAINVTASGAKAGDAMTVYSFDSATGAWTFAGTESVDASGNISPSVTHLSIWAVFKTATPPPVKPTGITVTAGDAQAIVSWSAVTGATSYKIYYGTAAGVTTSSITKVASAVTPQTVTGLTNGTTYYFVVTALNAAGESVVSAEQTATPVLPPPAKPAGIVASGGDGQVTVSWSAVTGATSYNVYYAQAAGQETGVNGTKVANALTPKTITGLTNGTSYFFVVTAVNAGGESGVSSEKSATPSAAPQAPGSPTGVVVSSPSAGQVHLVWSAVSVATSYNVYYLASATAPTNAQVLAGTAVSSTTASQDITLTSGTKYYFLVTAVNAGGESGTQTSAKNVTVL
jgi:fibronectin type 3 domain-containing protein